MNKIELLKLVSKCPLPVGTPAQEVIKIAALILATCLACKVEDILKALEASNASDIIKKVNNDEEGI